MSVTIKTPGEDPQADAIGGYLRSLAFPTLDTSPGPRCKWCGRTKSQFESLRFASTDQAGGHLGRCEFDEPVEP